MTSSARLGNSSVGFRERYVSYEAITKQLHAWKEERPELVKLDSIGRTPQGRDIWMLSIGRDLAKPAPAVWIDGNMHASELCGSSVALAVAEDVLRCHAGDGPASLPESVRAIVRELHVHVVPRISPDGAEHVLNSGAYVRSVPRDRREGRGPRWVTRDMDGDGRVMLMRVRSDGGELVESPEVPGVLVPRTIEDEGPFYKLFPEGTIEGFDGASIPTPHFLADNDPDLNRNFPWSWAPDPMQIGAGAFPGSEPESRAVIEAAARLPNLFLWLNLHTFGGVFIRPLGNAPDSKMPQRDLALWKQLEDVFAKHTGYPTVSGFEEFTYEPDKPLHGDLSDYAFHARGCIAYVCELWDLFAEMRLPRPKRFVDYYDAFKRPQIEQLARWDREHNHGRVFAPWQPFDHPQLGRVEIGGIDPRVGLWNPPYERIAGICEGHSLAFLRIAALAPRLRLEVTSKKVEGDISAIEARVANVGYLPTYVLEHGKSLAINEPIRVRIDTDCALVTPNDTCRDVGHLEGWGSAALEGHLGPHHQRTQGTTHERVVRFLVRGRGRVAITAGSLRMGQRRVEVDA